MSRVFALLLLVTLGGCAAEDRPSFLLYVVDTLRADALGCYGGPKTPNVDRLAASSILYENAYAASAWTRPSMASLLTGLPPGKHGAEGRGDALPAELSTLPAVLGDAGYRTAFITANPNAGGAFGFGSGFDELIELYDRRGIGNVAGRELVASSAEVVDRAIAWLEENPEPFFLAILDVGPHHPFTPPGGSQEDVAALQALRGEILRDGTTDSVARRVRELADRLYGGEVQAMDSAFGRLAGHLRKAGRWERTLVVFTADHGEEFMEHGSVGHGHSLYEEVLRIPWIARPPAGPDAPAPQRVQTPVSAVDLPGNALALLGLAETGFETRPPSPRRPVVATLCVDGNHRVSVLDRDRKLVVDLTAKQASLFDLASDPGELTPLDDALEASRLQRTLRRHLGPGWQAPRECKDRFPDLPDDVQHALDALGYGEG